jgi:hypothetical protein
MQTLTTGPQPLRLLEREEAGKLFVEDVEQTLGGPVMGEGKARARRTDWARVETIVEALIAGACLGFLIGGLLVAGYYHLLGR